MLSNRLGGTVSNAIEAALHDRVSSSSDTAAPTQQPHHRSATYMPSHVRHIVPMGLVNFRSALPGLCCTVGLQNVTDCCCAGRCPVRHGRLSQPCGTSNTPAAVHCSLPLSLPPRCASASAHAHVAATSVQAAGPTSSPSPSPAELAAHLLRCIDKQLQARKYASGGTHSVLRRHVASVAGRVQWQCCGRPPCPCAGGQTPGPTRAPVPCAGG